MSYMPGVSAGFRGGGTYTNQEVEPTLEAYENIFGPSARDIKQDLQRFKRHGRWHLPDILKGPNQYLTDRVDGLITDATSSPFTSRILPYKYITNVDGKIKWNVWSFDEGLASRVPYESAARTLTQTKRSYAGFTVRQGMAIVLEHNFMMTEAGRQNFKNQLQQLVGSIQLTNDLDVHMALVLAPSHEKHMREKYMVQEKSSEQICREFVDLFGFVQKNQNALDILIEEAKATLRTWGSPMPDFMLCNSKLTFQLTMTPDATNYVTKGAEGVKRLRTGPDLPSYRGIGILHTRAFSLETGQLPRDILRRRVRVAEYYRITPHRDNHRRNFQLYNEGRDTWATFTFWDLLKKAAVTTNGHMPDKPSGGDKDHMDYVAALATRAKGQGSAQARPMLAAHLGARLDDPQNSYALRVEDLLYRLIDQPPDTEFVFEPITLGTDLIYAPGADTLFVHDDDYRVVANHVHLPDYMRGALGKYCTKHHFGPNISGTEIRKVILKANSICAYPRTLQGMLADHGRCATAIQDVPFSQNYMPLSTTTAADAEAYHNYVEAFIRQTGVTAGANAGVIAAAITTYGRGTGGGAPHGAAGGVPHGQVHTDLSNRLDLRNYLRYGIPVALMRNPASTRGTWDETFNATARDRANVTWEARLRDKGAFYHPNVYTQDGNADDFKNWGDYLGYNTIVTQELVDVLTMHDRTLARNDGEMAFYSSTWLYFLVRHQASAREARGGGAFKAVFEAIGAVLTAHINTLKGGTGMNRAELSANMAAQLAGVLGGSAHQASFGHAHPEKDRYWLWPNVADTDDVFDTRYSAPWAVKMREYIPQFHLDLNLTEAVLAQTQTPNMNFPLCDLTKPLVHADGMVEDPVECAINFVNMLAWRMWSDRFVPLKKVYRTQVGRWGNFADCVHRPLEYPSRTPMGALLLGLGPDPKGLPGGHGGDGGLDAMERTEVTQNIEVVIVRPNIEHYMLGIILGQGGESLGSTFWGQTELSCYDDSMHGIWGM